MATSTRLTIDDFEKLPDEAVKHRELIDGELGRRVWKHYKP